METTIQRSVESLQKIYAVIIALAISQAITAATDICYINGSFIVQNLYDILPAVVSFFVLIVPFYHGMNRHLDLCYIEKTATQSQEQKQGALLFDFVIFCFESILLFVFTRLISKGIAGFFILGLILLVDMIWGFISNWIHYNSFKGVLTWSLINLITLIIACFIYSATCFDNKPFLLMIISIVRTLVDYGLCWNFYFPKTKTPVVAP